MPGPARRRGRGRRRRVDGRRTEPCRRWGSAGLRLPTRDKDTYRALACCYTPNRRSGRGVAFATVAGTYVYIDALNFYYGAVKGTAYKWVDFEALARVLVPRDQLGLIRYFTANVKPRYPGDRAHERQHAFLRAVDANPLIDITRGHFRTDVKPRPLAETKTPTEQLFRPRLRPTWLVRLLLADARRRRTQPATFARVIDPEEKGSDVNLGTYLL
jgi:hypothetical protein